MLSFSLRVAWNLETRMMILGSLMSKLTEYVLWLYQERVWTNQELLIAALVFLVSLLFILRRRRKGAIRRIHPERLVQGSSVIGANLGGPRQSRHAFGQSRNGRSAHGLPRHEKEQKAGRGAKQPLRPDEQAGRSHWEIVKPRQPGGGFKKNAVAVASASKQLQRAVADRRQVPERFAQEAVEPAAAGEHLQRAIPEGKPADGPLERKVAELTVANEKLQQEVVQSKEAQERFDQRLIELTAANEQLRSEASQLRQAGQKGRTHRYGDDHRVVDDVEQKLCRKCGQWKVQSEFHKNASRKDGLARWCKICRAKAARKSREQPGTTND
jgi:hypothetical protein